MFKNHRGYKIQMQELKETGNILSHGLGIQWSRCEVLPSPSYFQCLPPGTQTVRTWVSCTHFSVSHIYWVPTSCYIARGVGSVKEPWTWRQWEIPGREMSVGRVGRRWSPPSLTRTPEQFWRTWGGEGEQEVEFQREGKVFAAFAQAQIRGSVWQRNVVCKGRDWKSVQELHCERILALVPLNCSLAPHFLGRWYLNGFPWLKPVQTSVCSNLEIGLVLRAGGGVITSGNWEFGSLPMGVLQFVGDILADVLRHQHRKWKSQFKLDFYLHFSDD